MKTETQQTAPKREMVVKWASSLPNRMAILKFWEWMQKESASFREDSSGYDIEKLLDRYHEIDRIKLDDERRAMLESVPTPQPRYGERKLKAPPLPEGEIYGMPSPDPK